MYSNLVESCCLLKNIGRRDERHISSFQNSNFRRLASRKKLTLWTVLHRPVPRQTVDKNAQKSFDAFYGRNAKMSKIQTTATQSEDRGCELTGGAWQQRLSWAANQTVCCLHLYLTIFLSIYVVYCVFLLIYSGISPSLVTVRIHPFSQASNPTVFRRALHSCLLFSSSTKLRWVENMYFSFHWKSYHLAATRLVNAW